MDYADMTARASAPRALRAGRRPRPGQAAILGALAAVVAIAAGVPGPAAAAGSARAAQTEQRLRQQGQEALTAKDYDAAARAFTELYRLTRQPEGLYHLGIVAHAQGRLLDAQDLLRRFLSDPRTELLSSAAAGPEAGPLVERQAEARRILALPRPPSGKLNLIGASGTLVYLDARLVGSLPLSRPLLVAPGKHTLQLEDGGHRQQEEIDAALGRFLELTYDRSAQALLSTELPGVLLRETYSGLAEADAQKLGQAVEDLVQRERLSPFPVALALAQGGEAASGGCLQVPSCLCRLAQKIELEYVFDVHVTQRAAGAAWQLQLELLDAEIEESAARREVECSECDVSKATAALQSALPALLAQARQRPRAELKVTSTPQGAAVRAGGRLLGTTPLQRPVWAGALELTLTLSGYKTERVPATAAEGKPTELAVTLEPEVTAQAAPAPPVERPAPRRELARPRWRLGLGGAALGLGVLLGGFGISALAVNDSCVPGTPAAAETCRQRFATTAVGGGLLAAGVAAEVAGILLLAIPNRSSP